MHEGDSCAAADTDGDGAPEAGGAAGGHFNPTGSPHGAPSDEPDARHAGDLGNIVADADGLAVGGREDHVLTFDGETSLVGRAMMVHGGADDPGQPAQRRRRGARRLRRDRAPVGGAAGLKLLLIVLRTRSGDEERRGRNGSSYPTPAVMPRLPFRSLALLAALASLTACETTENVADTAIDGIEDGAEAVADVAVDAADAVADAAGSVYNTAEDVFTDDPDVTDVALVRPTSAPGAEAQGTVRFREEGDGLQVMVSLSGLTPGPARHPHPPEPVVRHGRH